MKRERVSLETLASQFKSEQKQNQKKKLPSFLWSQRYLVPLRHCCGSGIGWIRLRIRASGFQKSDPDQDPIKIVWIHNTALTQRYYSKDVATFLNDDIFLVFVCWTREASQGGQGVTIVQYISADV
jgi:hypothetical protein